MHKPRDPKKTKTPTSPTVWRSMSLGPRLDLWVMMFTHRNQIRRSEFTRQALLDALRKHDPGGEPSGTMEEILEQRWDRRRKTGDDRIEYRDSLPVQLLSKRKQRRVD